MPDLTAIPLEDLLQHCRPLTQQLTPIAEAAWRELLRRSLLQRNDSAWDALVQRLWPFVLHWIYSRCPNDSPAAVEEVAQRTIWAFLQAYQAPPPLGEPLNEPADNLTENRMAHPSSFSSSFFTEPDSIVLQLQRILEELLHEPR